MHQLRMGVAISNRSCRRADSRLYLLARGGFLDFLVPSLEVPTSVVLREASVVSGNAREVTMTAERAGYCLARALVVQSWVMTGIRSLLGRSKQLMADSTPCSSSQRLCN